jgi:hypothetical protein
MKNRALLFALFLFTANLAMAQRDTCKLGLYLNNVYDFDLQNKSFMADFWIWLNYKNDSLKFDDALSCPIAKPGISAITALKKRMTSTGLQKNAKHR